MSDGQNPTGRDNESGVKRRRRHLRDVIYALTYQIHAFERILTSKNVRINNPKAGGNLLILFIRMIQIVVFHHKWGEGGTPNINPSLDEGQSQGQAEGGAKLTSPSTWELESLEKIVEEVRNLTAMFEDIIKNLNHPTLSMFLRIIEFIVSEERIAGGNRQGRRNTRNWNSTRNQNQNFDRDQPWRKTSVSTDDEHSVTAFERRPRSDSGVGHSEGEEQSSSEKAENKNLDSTEKPGKRADKSVGPEENPGENTASTSDPLPQRTKKTGGETSENTPLPHLNVNAAPFEVILQPFKKYDRETLLKIRDLSTTYSRTLSRANIDLMSMF